MNLTEFDFELPEELIATRPVSPRSSARLLVSNGEGIADRSVANLLEYLTPKDRLVLNDTKVIPARLSGMRRRSAASGGSGEARIEVTLLHRQENGDWMALIKPLRKVALNETIEFAGGLSAQLLDKQQGQAVLRFDRNEAAFESALDRFGMMPLPPYIASKRAADAQDRQDYQTVFARHQGSVAAPTASLHFDAPLLAQLAEQNIGITYVTLHVGAGTFLPVKVEDIRSHKMHSEWGSVSLQAAEEIAATQAAGGRIIPVGTTALRLLETAARRSGQIEAWQGETDIFIFPGFEFNVASALMTNFHLPKSTLLMLVSALIGLEQMKFIYSHAIKQQYRFFSYGDSSLLVPER